MTWPLCSNRCGRGFNCMVYPLLCLRELSRGADLLQSASERSPATPPADAACSSSLFWTLCFAALLRGSRPRCSRPVSVQVGLVFLFFFNSSLEFVRLSLSAPSAQFPRNGRQGCRPLGPARRGRSHWTLVVKLRLGDTSALFLRRTSGPC